MTTISPVRKGQTTNQQFWRAHKWLQMVQEHTFKLQLLVPMSISQRSSSWQCSLLCSFTPYFHSFRSGTEPMETLDPLHTISMNMRNQILLSCQDQHLTPDKRHCRAGECQEEVCKIIYQLLKWNDLFQNPRDKQIKNFQGWLEPSVLWTDSVTWDKFMKGKKRNCRRYAQWFSTAQI